MTRNKLGSVLSASLVPISLKGDVIDLSVIHIKHDTIAPETRIDD